MALIVHYEKEWFKLNKVIDILSQPRDKVDNSRMQLINRTKSDKASVLQELLMTIEPEEIGGRTALAGFYYQFLVTIEYMIEVMEGKWDFVSLELHEDIIVGKNNRVRFVQVKTSYETDLKVSNTGIYSRTPKEVDGQTHRRPDSWVDKLLMKAKYFPASQGFQTEFELVTSFIVIGSKKMDVSFYSKNSKFSNPVPNDDDLFSRLSESAYHKDTEEPVEYNTICGEELASLLSRFYIHKKNDLSQINQYINHILYLLSDKILPGVRVSIEDLQWLVGLMMEKCQAIGDNLVLYMSADEVEEIRQNLHDRALQSSGESIRKHNSIEVIHTVFDQMLHDIKEIDLYTELESEIHRYKVHLIDWIQGGGTIRSLLNRYLDGKEVSQKYMDITEIDQTNKLLELFNCSILLILINEDLLRISDKHSTLLVKEIHSEYFSFLSLSRRGTVEEAIEKIRQMFQDPEKSMDIILHPPSNVLLQGQFKGSNGAVKSITIFEASPQVEGLPLNNSLKNMRIVLDFMPGGQLTEEYNNLFHFNNMPELRQHLREFWAEFSKGGADGSL